MDQAGNTETVDYLMAAASGLPHHPPASLSSPTCQETQLNMPTSSASTGGLSEVVEVHPFDYAILFPIIQSKRLKTICIKTLISPKK